MKLSRFVTTVATALALMGQGALALARPCLCASAPTSVAGCCCGPASGDPSPSAHGCCAAPAPGDATAGHCGDEGGRCARELLGDLSASPASSPSIAVAPAELEPLPAFLPVEVEPLRPVLRVGRAAESPPPPLLALRVARTTVLRI